MRTKSGSCLRGPWASMQSGFSINGKSPMHSPTCLGRITGNPEGKQPTEALVLGRLLDVVNHHHINRRLHRKKSQAQLLFEGSKQRWPRGFAAS